MENGERLEVRSVNSPPGEHRRNHPHERRVEGEIILEAAETGQPTETQG